MASQINASNSGFGGIVSTGDSSGQLQLQTAGTTALTLDTSQNATFAGKVTSAGALTLASNGTTTALTIDTSQNVLIGATSASGFDSGADNLIVGGGSGSNGLTIYAGSAGVGTINFANGNSGSSIYAGGINYNHSNNRMSFYTIDGTGRMFIDSSGYLLVGTSNSTPSSSNPGVRICSPDTASIWARSGTSTVAMINFVNGNGTVGHIDTSGSNTSYVTSSDYRLKENIVPMTGALDTVAALKPVTYTWKIDGSDGQGFIAHELQEVVPDCVTGEKDAVDEEGNIKPQGIDTSFLVATLTAAIQEMKAIIDAQSARIDALENK